MKNVKGWQLPEWDNHYETMVKEYNGKWEYQKDTRDFSLGFVKNWNIALDIGANIGFWSQDMCNKFKTVVGFEPHPAISNTPFFFYILVQILHRQVWI